VLEPLDSTNLFGGSSESALTESQTIWFVAYVQTGWDFSRNGGSGYATSS
jgi:hypothetical protein